MHRTKMEIERRNRILISVYAYAYEIENVSLVSDKEFDDLSKKIDFTRETENKLLDDFFFFKFEKCTGMWIHEHPELEKVKKLYESYFKKGH